MAEAAGNKSDQVQVGLKGVISHRSAISSIQGSTLTYRGIPIEELAEKGTFEEVVLLLWDGMLPRAEELEVFKETLRAGFRLPQAAVRVLEALPRGTNPMHALECAVAALAACDPDADDGSEPANRRKAERLLPQLAAALCAFQRLRNGAPPLEARNDLDFAGNFLHLLTGRDPEPEEIRAFDTALILHADHELNASTFAARVTASTLSDLHSAIVSAIATLKGPLHGGANRAVMETLEEIRTPERVEGWLDEKLARRERIMGFGHRVYREGDPRARILRGMSERLCLLRGRPDLFEISSRLEALMRERKGLLPNVDFYSATTYYCLGIPPDLYTAIFAASRVAGWTAHLFEQYADNALIRPRALYVGPTSGRWVPLEKR